MAEWGQNGPKPQDKGWSFPRALTQQEQSALKLGLAEAKFSLKPASEGDAGKVMVAMRARYRERGSWRNLSKDELGIIADEWIEDLCEYPGDLIREAYRLWRHGRGGFPPSDAGEMMALVAPIMQSRKALADRMAKLVQAAEVNI